MLEKSPFLLTKIDLFLIYFFLTLCYYEVVPIC